MIKFAAFLPPLFMAGMACAAPLTLTPADPQPQADALAAGLAVAYAYPKDVHTLEEARDALGKARAGSPLQGLSYADNTEGDLTMTARAAQKVAAQINGFIHFDAAGTYEVDVFSNDGIQLSLGGAEVALFDDIHGCEAAGVQEVEVPQAGWYAVEAVYFQRKGSACLMMDWNVDGAMGAVPDTAFAHLP